MKTTFAFITVLIASLFTGCATSHHRTCAWEYRVIEGVVEYSDFPKEKLLESRLNAAAKEGYVIVSAHSVVAPNATVPSTIVILKRPRK